MAQNKTLNGNHTTQTILDNNMSVNLITTEIGSNRYTSNPVTGNYLANLMQCKTGIFPFLIYHVTVGEKVKPKKTVSTYQLNASIKAICFLSHSTFNATINNYRNNVSPITIYPSNQNKNKYIF